MSPRAGYPGTTSARAPGHGRRPAPRSRLARNHTDADSALVVAAGPGAVMVHLGPIALPDR